MNNETTDSGKLPWVKFFFKDYMNDIALKRCSMAAQGFWIHMLGIMHEGKPYGHLTIGNVPVGCEDLMIVLCQSKRNVQKWMGELEKYGVYSKDSNGVIFNRRMVRDESARRVQREMGSMGGNPNLAKNYHKSGNIYALKNYTNGTVKIGLALNPTHRTYKIRGQHPGQTIEMIKCWIVDDMGASEQEIHNMFSHKKTHGEWFNLTEKDIETIDLTLKGRFKGGDKGRADLPINQEVRDVENGEQHKPLRRRTAVKHLPRARMEEGNNKALLAQESQQLQRRKEPNGNDPPEPLRDFQNWAQKKVPNWATKKAPKLWKDPEDKKALEEIFSVYALHEVQALWQIFIRPGSPDYDYAVGQRFSMREFLRQIRHLVDNPDYPGLKRRFMASAFSEAPA